MKNKITFFDKIIFRITDYLKIPITFNRIWCASIEIIGKCNLNCRMCGFDGSRKKGIMSFNLFKKIINELADLGCPTIALHVYGEPLLHPRLAEFIDYINQKKLSIILYTNGTLLNNKIIKLLKNHPVNALRISFVPYKKIYKNFWSGANYEIILNNLFKFLEESQTWDFKTNLDLNLLHEHNENINKLKNKAKKIFGVYPNLRFSFNEMINLEGSDKKIKYAPLKNKIVPCKHVYTQCAILFNGDVVPCCNDLNGKYIMDNIKKQKYSKIRNNKKFISFRKKMLAKSINELKICRTCPECRSNNPSFIEDFKKIINRYIKKEDNQNENCNNLP